MESACLSAAESLSGLENKLDFFVFRLKVLGDLFDVALVLFTVVY